MSKRGELINKYLDKELSNEDKEELEKIVSEDENLKKELKELKEMQKVMNMLKPANSDQEWENYWQNLYNRLERGIGWILISIGAILVLAFLGFEFIKDLIQDPKLALYFKIGLMALLLGLIILFVSVVRERILMRKYDKYSKEVKR
ncbi:MAG: hypothetical protein U9N06_06515 [candidate division WOR-3 bacterium]|nr:hypothetical protein [candidate division WOR-3 bacterium]